MAKKKADDVAVWRNLAMRLQDRNWELIQLFDKRSMTTKASKFLPGTTPGVASWPYDVLRDIPGDFVIRTWLPMYSTAATEDEAASFLSAYIQNIPKAHELLDEFVKCMGGSNKKSCTGKSCPFHQFRSDKTTGKVD